MSIPSIQHRSTAPAEGSTTSMPSTTLNLLIALLVLLFVALLCVGALYTIRRVRRSRAISRQSLPQYNDIPQSTSSHYNSKRLTINVYDEKASILSNVSSPPQSPVPEIRITFPDEHDETTGRRKSGRVLVVRVGEKGAVGLEPMRDEEQLPAYQKDGGRESFQDVDIERIGGLKEKKDIYS